METIFLSEAVRGEIAQGILTIISAHPPVNVLSPDLRKGLAAGFDLLEARPDLTAAVLICEGKSFFAGSDMTEFGGEIAKPDLPSLIRQMAALRKPVIAAMHGTALGGGFELALAARARVALASAKMGLPEVTLGLLPACRGVEVVTRLAGVDAALDLAISGRTISGAEAAKLGLVDHVVEDELRAAAFAMALNPPSLCAAQADPRAAEKIAAFKADQGAKLAGQDAAAEILKLIALTAADPARDLSTFAQQAFFRLEAGEQSKALRHIFAAERKLKDLPFLPADTVVLPITQAGVVGAGTMGSGIATVLLSAGLQVTLCDSAEAGLSRGADLIAANLAGAVKRGKMTEPAREAALARLITSTDLGALSQADLVIEAVFERLDIKQDVFARLDGICKPAAILATNTSFLDIDQIAAATRRPERVLGMHFFSPAHVMRLLEVVRGAYSAPEVIKTALDLGRRLGKVAVCVGNCHGFVGNRILLARQTAAMELLLAGVSPYEIDRAMLDFGIPMGPFQMADLAGLDVGWDRDGSAGRTMEEVLCEAGRLGMKNARGYYDYDEKGRASPSTEAMELIDAFRTRHPDKRQDIAPEAILDCLLHPMMVEVDAIIAEGIALRPSDIDVVWVHGYGWPRWRGGPAWYHGHR